MEASSLRILVTGGQGMLGSDLVPLLQNHGHSVTAPSHSELDVLVPAHLEAVRRKDYGDFDWVVNLAAYTAVDQAESEAMAAMRLNAVAPGALAFVCHLAGWKMLHVSTDFVFDGRAETPYNEYSPPNPISVYGKSKLQGEQNVFKELDRALVVRTSWLYGLSGKSFPRTMVELFEAGNDLKVVTDQVGKPTFTKALADTLRTAMELGLSGLYHAAGPEAMSWHDFASRAISTWATTTGQPEPKPIQGVPSTEFPRPAKRPAYSVLDTTKIESAGVPAMPSVAEGLTEFCAALAAERKSS